MKLKTKIVGSAPKRQQAIRYGTRRLALSSKLLERRKAQPFIDPEQGQHRDREHGIVMASECHSAARDHTWRYLPDKIINRYGRLVDPQLRKIVKSFQTGQPIPKRESPRIIKPKWNIERPRNWWHKTVEENPFIPTCADWYVSPTGVSGNTGAVGSPWNLAKGLSGGGGSIAAGDTLFYRSGTYYGGYEISMSGTALLPIKIKPYSSGGVTEQATFDQYIYGTITQALPVAAISAISRSGGTCTATVPSGHGFASGQLAVISGVSDGSFNGEFTISSTGSTSITYSQAGTASSSGGFASGGSCTISLTQGSMTDPFDEIIVNAAAGPGNVSPTTPASTNKAEAVKVYGKTGTGSSGTLTSLQRGWNGSGWNGGGPAIGYHQSSGSDFYISVNAFNVTGDHVQFWGANPTTQPWIISKVLCSNPLRSFPIELGGNVGGAGQGTGPTWQRSHAAFTASDREGLEIIGLCIKDSNDGVFISGVGGGHSCSSILAYNNGTVDNIRGHGQPLYIHTETGANFIDILSFSNFGSGSKFYGVNGEVHSCVGTRVHSFNNMAPASYTGNPAGFANNKYIEGNFFLGSENDPMYDNALYDCVFWNPYDSVQTFQHIKLGHGQACHDSIFDNNWIIGGDQILTMTLQKTLTFTRNLIVLKTVSTQSTECFVSDAATGDIAGWTWGTGGTINSFWNKGYLGSDPEPYNIQFYLNGTAVLNEFGTAHIAYDRPSTALDWLGHTGLVFDYHANALPTGIGGFSFRTGPCTDFPTRSHIAIVKWDGTSTGTFDLPAAELTAAGAVVGDDIRIQNAIDPFAGGANLIQVTNWDGNAVSIASGSFTRENPIGYTSEDWRGNTWTMGFGELMVFVQATGGAAPVITSISPNTGAQNTAPSITITGTDFLVGGTTVGVSGTGVTVGTVTVTGTTIINVTFTIASNATPGARTVTVTTADGSDTDTFTVTVPSTSTVLWVGA